MDHDDLEQVAMLALMGAVRRYRTGQGSGFSAFAVPSIMGELKRHFRDHGWAVRPPRSLQELHRDVLHAEIELEQQVERPPTDAEVAADLSVSIAEVRRARVVELQYRADSLDAPLERDSSASLLDVIPNGDDDPYERVVSRLSLTTAMKQLDDDELHLLDLRFRLELTQRQIGRRIGVSQMQVSRLLSRLLLRLRADIQDDDGDRCAGSLRLGPAPTPARLAT